MTRCIKCHNIVISNIRSPNYIEQELEPTVQSFICYTCDKCGYKQS